MRALAFVLSLLIAAIVPALSDDAPSSPAKVTITPGNIAWQFVGSKAVPRVVNGMAGIGAVTTLTPKTGFKFLELSFEPIADSLPTGVRLDLDPRNLELRAHRGGATKSFSAIAVMVGEIMAAFSKWSVNDGETVTVVTMDIEGAAGGLKVVFAVPDDFELAPTDNVLMMRTVPLVPPPAVNAPAAP